MTVLLHCPFCGGEPERRNAVGEYWVSCLSCEAASDMSSNEELAFEAWNKRPGKNIPTLRDQFAMAALTGLLAHYGFAGPENEGAERAYIFAKAMLAERAKQ